MCLVAAPALVALHHEVTEGSVLINRGIAIAREKVTEYPLSGGALLSIRADHLALHRSVLALCSSGWSLAAAPVLRTMLELMVSTAVVVADRAEAEYRGFKYTHVFLKANLNNDAFTDQQRKRMREQVEEGVALLPSEFREKAKNYVYKERTSPYWYFPEFSRPAEAIEKLCPPDVARLFSLLSGGAHGGFLGLRVLKDDPDSIHPNQRPDPRSQNLALTASNRLTLEVFRGCDRFEASGVGDAVIRNLFERFYALEPILRPA